MVYHMKHLLSVNNGHHISILYQMYICPYGIYGINKYTVPLFTDLNLTYLHTPYSGTEITRKAPIADGFLRLKVEVSQ